MEERSVSVREIREILSKKTNVMTCVPGIRSFCSFYGLDWKTALHEGIPLSLIKQKQRENPADFYISLVLEGLEES